MTSSHTSTLRRLAASAAVGTAATIALAAPAQAMFVHDPGTTGPTGGTSSTTTQAGDNGLLQVGLGAAGGIVLAGAAAGAAVGLHRRRVHVAHPA